MWSRLHVRWGNPPHVTSPTWRPPPSCKQALRIVAWLKPRMFCEESWGKLNLELFWNVSVHEFYRLKALISLEQVNTTEWSGKKTILISKIAMMGCCKLSLYANESCDEHAIYFRQWLKWRAILITFLISGNDVVSLELRPLNFRVFVHAYSLRSQTYFRWSLTRLLNQFRNK